MKAAGLAFLTLLAASVARPAEYAADAANSHIRFRAYPRFGGGRGTFREFSLEARVDGQQIERSSLSADIGVESIDTGIKARDRHLRSPDFFDAVRYPRAALKIVRIVPRGGAYEAEAELTLKGVTRTLLLPFEVKVSTEGLRAAGETELNRKDFGISYDSRLNPIRDNVSIYYDISFRKTD